jgi:hypothetical protein
MLSMLFQPILRKLTIVLTHLLLNWSKVKKLARRLKQMPKRLRQRPPPSKIFERDFMRRKTL